MVRSSGFPSKNPGVRFNRPTLWLACVATLFLCGAGLLHYRSVNAATSHTNMTAEEITQRANEICTAIFGQNEVPPVPRFNDQCVGNPQYGRHRRTWTVACRSNDLVIHLVFNDKTKQLSSVFSYCDLANPALLQDGQQIESRQDVIKMAIHWLQLLGMTPHGTRIELESSWPATGMRENWSTTWRIARPGVHDPYRVIVQLNRNSGLPAVVANRFELTQYTQDQD